MEFQTYSTEQNICAAILADNSALEKIDGQLSDADFSDPRNAFVFKEIVKAICAGEHIDFELLSARIKTRYPDKFEKISEYVNTILKTDASWSSINIVSYAKLIRENSVIRKLLKAADDIRELVASKEGKTVEDLLSGADNVLQSVISGHANNEIKLYTAQEMIGDLMADMDAAYSREGISGICTGIQKLNVKTDGLQKGNMIIVAGPASMGKTTFAMNLVKRAAETQKYPTVVFSMEMPYLDIIRRYISSAGRVDYKEIRTGRLETMSFNRASVAMSSVKADHKLIVCDNSSLNISLIRSVLKRVKREYGGVSCAMLDYVQMVDAIQQQGGNRNTELTIISRELKKIAREFEMPFIVLSQLSKDVEKAQRKPTNGDLRESGALAQDADVIMMVHREEKYKPDANNQGIASIIITKSRNGECGEVATGFDGSTFTFYDLESQR